jgi:hypothetical protein
MKENIKFEFELTAEFWDLPPIIDIRINQLLIQTHVVNQKKYNICFFHSLDLGEKYELSIYRYNKDDSQCVIDSNGLTKDQYLIIDKIKIDNVDIQNLIDDRSWYKPEYPVEWAKQQIERGHKLEDTVPGELWLSHNGTWYFNFTSPFYQYIINQFKYSYVIP